MGYSTSTLPVRKVTHSSNSTTNPFSMYRRFSSDIEGLTESAYRVPSPGSPTRSDNRTEGTEPYSPAFPILERGISGESS